MINLQRIARNVGVNIFKRNFSGPVSSFATKVGDESGKSKDSPSTTATTPQAPVAEKKQSKNPMIAAAFASLNDEQIQPTEEENKSTSSKLPTHELILNAKTVNGLLSISEKNGAISRPNALKIVSILAEWSSINKANLSDFENDPRFIKLCRILGRTPTTNSATQKRTNNDGNNANGPSRKISGFRTDDLNTVLGVTGDDEAAKLISTITLSQMVKVMSSLAQKKRRSTPLLRSLAYNISSNMNNLDLKQCGDLLYAMAVLNFPDPVLLTRICGDIQTELPKNKEKSSVVGSMLTSLGLLKYRNVETLDHLTEWIVKNMEICRPQDITSLFLTLATVNYQPTNLDELRILSQNVVENDLKKSIDWLNHIWSLVVLDLATEKQINSVLNSQFIEKLEREKIGKITPTIKMKLLNINAAANLFFPNYKGEKINDGNSIFLIPLTYNKEKQILVNGMLDALKSLLTSENYVHVNTDTKMGFAIDAECVLDTKGLPLPLNKDSKNGKRIAIMVQDFHDMCHGTHETINGLQNLSIKLLEKSNYHVLTVPYTEFNTSDKLLKRVQYLEKKLKEIIVVGSEASKKN
uniref:RAP domain-containing protein n=1 Tax=Corethrella appendiculata TaxID=1370023 RepID=U5EU15_9DIPT